MSGAPLVVGYGNTLRMDDGIGPRAAERLADDPRMAGVTVMTRQQLTPDLVLDLRDAGLVVFIDAALDLGPGVVRVHDLAAGAIPAAVGAWSHHVDAGSLVALTAALFDRAPAAVVVRIGVGSVDAGEGLSPAVDAAMPTLLDTVVDAVTSRRLPHA